MARKATIRDVDVSGKTCLCRVDYNVPMKGNTITDDSRIRASLPTLNYLIEHGARVVLVSHLGRPGGKPVPELRLDPVADKLSELLGKPVRKLDQIVGPEVANHVRGMQPGGVVLLENVRFDPREEKNDPGFARELASLADIFVNDAFGACHRAHASTAGVAAYIPGYAGLLMEKEIESLSRLLEEPERPYTAVIGGAKISDKLAVLSNLLDRVDALLIGGGMANTFLMAMGFEVGRSLCEPQMVEEAQKIMSRAQELGKTLLLPEDLVVAAEVKATAPSTVVSRAEIPSDSMALDIGPRTRSVYASVIGSSRTVFWNGPMGVFEVEPFRTGTMDIARAIAEVRGFTVVGGGDSLAAIEMSGVASKISHLSTGGGASLEFLEGRTLPGIACLQDK